MAPEDEPSTDDDDDDNRTHGELVDRFIALTRGETQRGKVGAAGEWSSDMHQNMRAPMIGNVNL